VRAAFNGVPISPTLAELAQRLNIDLASVADGVLRDHLFREAMAGLTPRMKTAMLAAHEVSLRFGHSHIGCEHMFLAIVLDPESIPSQILRRGGSIDDVLQRLDSLLRSEQYNAPLHEESTDKQ
jgi:hypothetical protein